MSVDRKSKKRMMPDYEKLISQIPQLGEELLSSKLIYFIMHLIDQWFFAWDFDGKGVPTGETRFNCEAELIDYLAQHGYFQIIKGVWPETKRLKFILTEKGKQFFT